MPIFGPLKRKQLIYYLRQLDFNGPYSGGNHEYMVKGSLKLFIPNPHEGQIGRGLLLKLLHQGNISREEWEQL